MERINLKYLMIINPRAGKSKKIEDELFEYFANKGERLDIVRTRKPLDAKKIAKRAIGKYKVVIAAGGDGTINETINGLAKSDVALGIIPNGTENVLAKELKIPLDTKKAAQRILAGKKKRYDLGKAGRRYFIMMSGVGLDAKTAHDMQFKPILKKMLGRGSYPLAALQTYFKYRPKKLKIWIDNQVLPRWGYFAIIGNIKLYGGNLKITPMAEPDDGYLDVCIFKNKDILSMMKYLIHASTKNKMVEVPSIEYFRGKEIRIQSEDGTMVHTDAEIVGKTPIKITIEPKAIDIIS